MTIYLILRRRLHVILVPCPTRPTYNRKMEKTHLNTQMKFCLATGASDDSEFQLEKSPTSVWQWIAHSVGQETQVPSTPPTIRFWCGTVVPSTPPPFPPLLSSWGRIDQHLHLSPFFLPFSLSPLYCLLDRPMLSRPSISPYFESPNLARLFLPHPHPHPLLPLLTQTKNFFVTHLLT